MPSFEFLEEHASSLLSTANYLGCTQFKIVAQSEIVQSELITVANAANLFLLAGKLDCALLKEATMDFFAANANAVMSSSGFSVLQESGGLLTELMARLVRTGAEEVSVAEMWEELDKRGLDLDGSRETLMERLGMD